MATIAEREAVLPPQARENDGFFRKKWTVEECRFLADNGRLTPGKYELVEGEIVYKMGQGRLHAAAVTLAIRILTAVFGDRVQTQTSIGIGELDEFNDPEPDIAVLKETVRDYLEREPYPATEVPLVVEVSKTTLMGDRTTKAAIYARSGIAEYWIIALEYRQLIVHRQPGPDGYAEVTYYNATEQVAPLASPQTTIAVADLLP